MSSPSFPRLHLPLSKLVEFIAQPGQPRPLINTLETFPITSGHVAASVFRLDLRVRHVDGQEQTHSFIQKHTRAAEIQIMKLLSYDVPLAELPALVDAYANEEIPYLNGASWFISPFYDGVISHQAATPPAVVRALATIHAFYASRPERLLGLPRLDKDYLDGLHYYVSTEVDQHQARLEDSTLAALREQLRLVATTEVLEIVLQRLPLTLTHGDVHAGNIVHTPAGSHILFDWGNGRVAPAMHDLANTVPMDSNNWTVYIETWREKTGEPLDMEVARLGYQWATAMVNLQYLPFAIAYMQPEAVLPMVNKLRDAVLILGKTL
jgi:aminoglycoside phosphotransferase (APT) family kinase protein